MTKPSSGRRSPRLSLGAILAVIVVAGLLAGAPYIGSRISERKTASEYEGTVVRKTAGVRQSKYGSRAKYFLIIKTSKGERITVQVPAFIYDESVTGMHVSKRAGEPLPTLSKK